ncbi:choline dehydrogenase [Virgisporangium aliadipatigenens]|uniref:Choline dehydrogenase n=1 Tax=Virgisporangium aliadipatigenens TaxID=741659 RepID=A0A8J4DP21_9ACTN|nr:GMC family oxidoreductase N-terminal domain-containing protein [Virgisporangium aliadipatigenens]GIJ45490.1 choline dehydrogenase [Virgisporangium aliadipatigenens]
MVEPRYDFVVCGAGSAGSALAGRLAEDPAVSVLLVEAGGEDRGPSIDDPELWPLNLGTERVWNFATEPDPGVNGRSLPYAMGRVLGGGGSVNVSIWIRGHRDDWDFIARETGDPAWGHEAVRETFDRIENDPMWVRDATDLHPYAQALLTAAGETGFARHDHPNGALMEAERGAAPRQEIIRNGRRQSPFRSYVGMRPRPNLTVLSGTLVTEVLFEKNRAVGVRLRGGGTTREVRASTEVVLSLGAVNTPRTLLLSGVGDPRELAAHSIAPRVHLPGVGRNLNDHALISLVWRAADGAELRAPGESRAGVFWNLTDAAREPPVFMYSTCSAAVSQTVAARTVLPERVVTFMIGMRMRGTGRVRLASADPTVDPLISTGYFADPADLTAARHALETARAVGTAPALRPYLAAEVLPGPVGRDATAAYLRDVVETFWHQSGTARMGRDDTAVVDPRLRVVGCEGLRVADASVLPRVTVANTMAPSVLVGERAAAFIRADHGLAG